MACDHPSLRELRLREGYAVDLRAQADLARDKRPQRRKVDVRREVRMPLLFLEFALPPALRRLDEKPARKKRKKRDDERAHRIDRDG